MKSYYVEAHTNSDSFAQDIEARDLHELAKFVRETFAYMNGCHDTSEIDVSWINFDYDYVEDENGDCTAEAQKHI